MFLLYFQNKNKDGKQQPDKKQPSEEGDQDANGADDDDDGPALEYATGAGAEEWYSSRHDTQTPTVAEAKQPATETKVR